MVNPEYFRQWRLIMKKIIHLSDLHIGYTDLFERAKHIIKLIEFTKPEPENYVIVITGDLTEAPTKSNYNDAKDCIDYLRSKKYTVLPIPGNHDYSEFIYHHKKYVPRFKETFFEKSDIFFTTYESKYPKIDLIGNKGEEIAFIGLDSMADELHWYDSLWANGELGETQLKRLNKRLRLKEVVNSPYKVIYLHHHPFNPLNPLHKLKDAKEFINTLKQYMLDDPKKHKISALLFGHNHHCDIWNGQGGIPRCYDGGTSTRKTHRGVKHRVIDLSRDACFDYDGNFLRGYFDD
jgi:3',5'-cyclic AMP phosphodiesterase CpdA